MPALNWRTMKNFGAYIILIAMLGLTALGSAADKSPNQKAPVAKPDTISAPVASDPSTIKWMKYDEGLALAKKLNKKAFVEFTAKWCGWCKRMQATTFKDSGVIAMIDKYFVPISVDGDSKDTLNVDGWLTTETGLTKDTYHVTGYPMFWFLTPTGDMIAPLSGYREAPVLMDILDYLKDDQYKTVTFQAFMDDKYKKKN
jgi:thioredoxin-related protein